MHSLYSVASYFISPFTSGSPPAEMSCIYKLSSDSSDFSPGVGAAATAALTAAMALARPAAPGAGPEKTHSNS